MSIEAGLGQNFSFSGVPSSKVADLSFIIQPFIDLALAHSRGEITSDDILEFAQEGVMQIWVAGETNKVEAVLVTQLVEYPRLKALRVIGLAGHDAKRFQPAWHVVEAWAIEHGCRCVEAPSRRGMARWAKELGMTEIYSMVGKDLSGTKY